MVSASLPVLEFDDMTFQIGMVTDEGVLLASDRKVNNLAGFRHGLLIPKITVHQKQDFAHCSAGDESARKSTTGPLALQTASSWRYRNLWQTASTPQGRERQSL
jgi:hypothetical protein